MSKQTLGGIFFVLNGDKQDYNWRETAWCLSELCDQVVVVDCGSDDNTDIELKKLELKYSNFKAVLLPRLEWDAQKTQSKLSFFQNIALSYLKTSWYVLCQADELIHESSFSTIRGAIELPYEGFLCRRFNMYGDFNHYLNVPQERKPVSDIVMRLSKTKYLSYDDGESIAVSQPTSSELIEQIKIYHFGFVRSREKQLVKMRHMMDEVFCWGADPKIKGKDKFYPWDFFNPSDVVSIREPLPKHITQWAAERAHEFEKF